MNNSNFVKYQNISLFLSLVIFFGCGLNKNPKKSTISLSTAKETVVDNLKRPWSMAFLSEEKAIVSEKDGDLLKVNLNTKEKISIEGLPEDIADSLLIFAENYPRGTYPTGVSGKKMKYNAGLLDVVLDPNFEENQWVYFSYAAEKEKKYATKVIRAQLKDNKLINHQILLEALPYTDGLFHFGGALLFGTDGMLYCAMGERLFGDALQPDIPIAQDLSDPRGKIFRIHSDGSIPTDNPDFGANAVPGMYAAGIRNVQGLALDSRTGDIWFTEHGTIQGDELNLLEAGANYGWPIVSTGGYRGGYEPPKMEGDFTVSKWFWHKTIAPTGLTFYTGNEFPSWKNSLIVPGLSRGNFWRLVIEDNTIKSVEELFIDNRDRTRKAVQSPEGQLYILTDEVDGRIVRIINAS